MQSKILLYLPLLLLVSLRGAFSNPLIFGANSCGVCNRRGCEEPVDCPGAIIRDTCGCCDVCAKEIGDPCVVGECDIAAGVMCIPDDPYGAAQTGTCQELTGCFTFGCEAIDGKCQCSYANECPLQVFSYSTLVDCEASLQESDCVNVDCPIESCPEGMIYDPGFVMLGECCPVGGTCMCDFSQCGVPSCANGTEAVLVSAANDTDRQCCDVYECREVEPPSCDFYGAEVPHGDSVPLGPCTMCECNYGSLNCIQEACPLLNCQSGKTFIPEGQCCPVCFPVGPLNPTPSPSDLPPPPVFSNCIASDGQVYVDGDRWKDDACTSCRCLGGRTLCRSIQCGVPLCDNPISLPDVCCPVCPEIVSPTSTASVDASTTHVPLPTFLPPPVVLETESPPQMVMIVLILDIPLEEFEADESQIVTRLKQLVNGVELEVTDMAASAYGEKQTYLALELLLDGDSEMSEEEVAVMVEDNSQAEPLVLKVGTFADIPAGKSRAEQEENSNVNHKAESSGDSTQSTLVIAVVVVSVSAVALLVVAGSIVTVVLIIRRRRKTSKSSQVLSEPAKNDA